MKYLGMILQDHLYWNLNLSQLCKKLSRGIGLLSKVRHYLSKDLLKAIYYSIFTTPICYMDVKVSDKNKTADCSKTS